MGLIKAALGAAGGVLADQWKEFFHCDAMPSDVLACRGKKKITSRSSNTKGDENVITNGSVIVVNEGQCMVIVEQGKVVELSAEPGEYTYRNDLAPTIFEGGLGKGIKDSFAEFAKRFSFGGDAAVVQRVYFMNMREIAGNKYGTQNPVPFRVVDNNIGLDVDISIRCNGEYSYKIVNPMLFFQNVCANFSNEFKRSEIDSRLKTDILTALQPAFAKISEMGIRYSALPAHTMELADALNQVLSKKWAEGRGIEIFAFGVNSVTASPEDEQMIKDLQKTAVMRNPGMAAASLVNAQSDAMRAAASNSAGAMTGFMGLGMVNNMAGGMNAQGLFQMNQQQAPQQQAPQQQATQAAASADSWKGSCGAVNTGKFCMECGGKKPEEPQGWKCSCGAVNLGKFCQECGAKKPSGVPLYKCDKCGWVPEDPKNPPKFCPECGDVFDDNDIQ